MTEYAGLLLLQAILRNKAPAIKAIIEEHNLKIIFIFGPCNAGKSTIFNELKKTISNLRINSSDRLRGALHANILPGSRSSSPFYDNLFSDADKAMLDMTPEEKNITMSAFDRGDTICVNNEPLKKDMNQWSLSSIIVAETIIRTILGIEDNPCSHGFDAQLNLNKPENIIAFYCMQLVGAKNISINISDETRRKRHVFADKPIDVDEMMKYNIPTLSDILENKDVIAKLLSVLKENGMEGIYDSIIIKLNEVQFISTCNDGPNKSDICESILHRMNDDISVKNNTLMFVDEAGHIIRTNASYPSYYSVEEGLIISQKSGEIVAKDYKLESKILKIQELWHIIKNGCTKEEFYKWEKNYPFTRLFNGELPPYLPDEVCKTRGIILHEEIDKAGIISPIEPEPLLNRGLISQFASASIAEIIGSCKNKRISSKTPSDIEKDNNNVISIVFEPESSTDPIPTELLDRIQTPCNEIESFMSPTQPYKISSKHTHNISPEKMFKTLIAYDILFAEYMCNDGIERVMVDIPRKAIHMKQIVLELINNMANIYMAMNGGKLTGFAGYTSYNNGLLEKHKPTSLTSVHEDDVNTNGDHPTDYACDIKGGNGLTMLYSQIIICGEDNNGNKTYHTLTTDELQNKVDTYSTLVISPFKEVQIDSMMSTSNMFVPLPVLVDIAQNGGNGYQIPPNTIGIFSKAVHTSSTGSGDEEYKELLRTKYPKINFICIKATRVTVRVMLETPWINKDNIIIGLARQRSRAYDGVRYVLNESWNTIPACLPLSTQVWSYQRSIDSKVMTIMPNPQRTIADEAVTLTIIPREFANAVLLGDINLSCEDLSNFLNVLLQILQVRMIWVREEFVKLSNKNRWRYVVTTKLGQIIKKLKATREEHILHLSSQYEMIEELSVKNQIAKIINLRCSSSNASQVKEETLLHKISHTKGCNALFDILNKINTCFRDGRMGRI